MIIHLIESINTNLFRGVRPVYVWIEISPLRGFIYIRSRLFITVSFLWNDDLEKW